MKKKVKAENEILENARAAFDYMTSMSMDQIKKGQSVLTTAFAVIVEYGEKEMGILPISLHETESAEERMMVMDAFGEMLARKGTEAYMFMTIAEAWASTRSKNKKTSVRPSLDPNRKEVFMASAKDSTGYVRHVIYEIKRKTKGVEFDKIALLGKSQKKYMFDWVDPTKEKRMKTDSIVVDYAWNAYNKTKKELTTKK